MSEQGQFAKLRRVIIRGTLRLFGPAVVARVFPLTMPETAAVAANRPRPRTTPRKLVLAIPIVGRHQVSDWSVIEETLARTLASFQHQSDPNWCAMICGQDRPACLPDDDSRIRFVPFTRTVKGHDKTPKLQCLAAALPELGIPSGLFMPFDGDDLLHPQAVEGVQTETGDGFLLEDGFIMNAATGEIAATARRTLAQMLQKPFWKFCGSCAAFPFDLSDGTSDITFFQELAKHEHRLYPYMAALAGMKLHAGAVPQVLYLINHGENFETRRGRGGFKQRFVTRHAISDADRIARTFGIDPD